jgi:four helix bundle protein
MVNFYHFLIKIHKDYVISKQLLRCSTSVTAQIYEAEFGQSKPDFVHKLSLSQKEKNETMYWLELLFRIHNIDEKMYTSLNEDAKEILKLITASINTVKRKTKFNDQ